MFHGTEEDGQSSAGKKRRCQMNIPVAESLLKRQGVSMEKEEKLDRVNLCASIQRPPLLFCTSDYSSTVRSVLNISTRKFHTIECPDFEDASCLSSKGGWLLMQQFDLYYVHRPVPLYLLNPVSGVRLDLPKIRCVTGPFTFSIASGTPDCVFHVDSCTGCFAGIAIQVAHPGDEAWEVHEFSRLDFRVQITTMALVGKLVLCFDHLRAVISFDLTSGSWAVVSQDYKRIVGGGGKTFTAETEGKIARIFSPDGLFKSFNFARLDLRAMDWPWVEMNQKELENVSWFLGHQSFSARGQGKKVYILSPNAYRYEEDNRRPCPKIVNMFGPLDQKTYDSLDPFYDPFVADPSSTGKSDHGPQPAGTSSLDASAPKNMRHLFSKSLVFVHSLEHGTTRRLLPNPFFARLRDWVDPDVLPCGAKRVKAGEGKRR